MSFVNADIYDIESIVFNEAGNSLTLSLEQLNALTSLTGSANATDTILISSPGILEITDAQFVDIDFFQGGNKGSNDIIDTSGLGLTLIGGDGSDYIDGGIGADFLQGNGGADAFVYLQGNVSRYAGETSFTGDTIKGFDFSGTDKIRLSNVFDGTVASLVIDTVWVTAWTTTLENNLELQAAFEGSDIDAALITINTGSAMGEYLLIEDGTTSTDFSVAEDITIKLIGATNQNFFDTADFFV